MNFVAVNQRPSNGTSSILFAAPTLVDCSRCDACVGAMIRRGNRSAETSPVNFNQFVFRYFSLGARTRSKVEDLFRED
jgi:hypothetical protein